MLRIAAKPSRMSGTVGDRLTQPHPSGRLDDGVPFVRQRGERDLVVVRQHRDLAMRRRGVALEQQVFQRALQAGHLLGQSLPAVLLRRALRLGHVIEQVHRAQDRGEAQQDERDRELEGCGDAHGYWCAPTLAASGIGRCAAPRGGAMRALGRPGGACILSTHRMTPRRMDIDGTGRGSPWRHWRRSPRK